MDKKIRFRICETCGKKFSYKIGKGTDRKHCSPKCRAISKEKYKKIRFSKLPECKTENCHNKANRISYGLCETCYYRIRRTGSTYKKKPAYKYITGHGYVVLSKPNHPLSDNTGRIYEHRYVVYNFYKGIEPGCFWCGKNIKWKDAVIDHLDENKKNNKIENLVFSCIGCNRARGAMLPFIKRIKESSFDAFINEIKKQRESVDVKS